MRPAWLALALLAAGPAPLVDASRVVPGLTVELRYATADNFLHRAVYPPSARCLLRLPVAQRLAKVARALSAQGLRLKVYDCYRPRSVQWQMWRIFPHVGYVANPATGSNHNRGAAVDLTLVDAQGHELPMPTPFDSFSSAAHQGDRTSSPQAQANRERLRGAMMAEGFRPIVKEWWHYDAPQARRYPVLDQPF